MTLQNKSIYLILKLGSQIKSFCFNYIFIKRLMLNSLGLPCLSVNLQVLFPIRIKKKRLNGSTESKTSTNSIEGIKAKLSLKCCILLDYQQRSHLIHLINRGIKRQHRTEMNKINNETLIAYGVDKFVTISFEFYLPLTAKTLSQLQRNSVQFFFAQLDSSFRYTWAAKKNKRNGRE